MIIPKVWSFKSSYVSKEFDKHVREQLPWYELCTFASVHLAKHFINEGSLIYDLGASTGNIGINLKEYIETRQCDYVPIDYSESMKQYYKGPSELIISDIRQYKYERFDVCFCFLTLMFLSVKDRSELLEKLFNQCNNGGCIIIVDKFKSSDVDTALINKSLTVTAKINNRVEYKEIVEKELSLIGYQKPFDVTEMHYAYKEFFRFGEFRGIYIKR